MENIKHHNKLWRTEEMFLYDYLEVPVSRDVFEAFHSTDPKEKCAELPITSTITSTPISNGINT